MTDIMDMKLEDLKSVLPVFKIEQNGQRKSLALEASKQKITDVIELKQSELAHLFRNIYDFDKLEDTQFSSDIVFANTIPLKDFRVKLNMDQLSEDSITDSMEYTFNVYGQCPTSATTTSTASLDNSVGSFINGKFHEDVVKFCDVAKYFAAKETEDFKILAANFAVMTVTAKYKSSKFKGMTIVIPLIIDKTDIRYDTSIIKWTNTDGINMSNNFKETLMGLEFLKLSDDIVEELNSYFWTGVMLFHGLNTLLLNPVVQDVFETHSSKEPIIPEKVSKKNKRGRIRYVKKHIIRSDDIDEAFKKRGFIRHSMIWYVTGHWREYQNGKRTFIQGYWKGALRHMKDTAFQDLEPRERELITEIINKPVQG